MLLRMSTLFLRTLRDDPADAEVPSHRLLVRAGYVRRVAPGIYSWLPLGIMVLRNVEQIVREEMNAIGSQEVLFPALIPREIFEAVRSVGRLRRLPVPAERPQGPDYLLGPTHEELFTLLVKGEYSSYKDYPLSLFQIQTKYRDEARPRAGVLRGREFIMKDSYSFDLSDEGLQTLLPGAPRRLRADLQPARASTTGSCSRSPGRWAARRRRSSWRRPRPARTPSSSARTVTTPPTPRRSRSRCRTPTTGRSTRRRWCWTPRTPRPSPPWWIRSTATTGRAPASPARRRSPRPTP